MSVNPFDKTKTGKKLIKIKKALNYMTPYIDYVIPEVTPKNPVATLLNFTFNEVINNVSLDPQNLFKDKNFPKMLSAYRKAFVYITEKDRAYTAHLFYIIQVMSTQFWQVKRLFFKKFWRRFYSSSKKKFKNFDKNNLNHMALLFFLYMTEAKFQKVDFNDMEIL